MRTRGLLIFFAFMLPLVAWADDSALSAQVQVLDEATFADDVDSAIIVQNANTGEVVYSRNADALLNPASNAKVLTTLAALSFLSPDFRFKTQLICEGDSKPEKKKSNKKKKKEEAKVQIAKKAPKDGELQILTLKGFGDPSFRSSDLEWMVRDLKAKGVRSVAEVRVDESYFDNRSFPGRDDGFNMRRFNVGSFFLDNNQIEVVVTPGESVGEKAVVNLNPPVEDLFCEGEVLTGERSTRVRVRESSQPDDLALSVEGSIALGSGPQVYHIPCEEPAKVAGRRLVDLLKRNGIEAPRQFRMAAAPEQGIVLVERQSTSLEELLPVINKKSDNFLAEQLAKVLGAEYGGEPGSTEKGVIAIARELNATGVDVSGLILENGSGLSRNSRVKAKTLVSALQKVYDNARLRSNFVNSLSVLGVDGTLRRRFRNTDLAGRFVGKTGTLRNVSALSGFAFPRSGLGEKTYIFSHLINGSGKGFWQQRQLMQQVLELLLSQ